MRFFSVAVFLLGLGALRAEANGKAEHVVLIVWDGMRPDFVTPQYTPRLFDLAQRGTFFARHHSAYVSTTEVNGTVLATGMNPDGSGIIANTEYRPEFNWLTSFGTEALEIVRRGDALSQGHYLQAPTIAETLHGAGFPTMVAAAKPIGLLQDRASTKTSEAEKNSVTLFRGESIPRRVMDMLAKARDVGPFPGAESADGADAGTAANRPRRNSAAASLTPTNSTPAETATSRAVLANAVDSWTAKALVRGLWKNGVPKYSVLWLSEPDAAQHAAGVGSEAAVSALENSDDQLAAVLKVLDEKGVLDSTDIFVVSDHGFSTINRGAKVVESLKKFELNATKQFINPEAGDILVDSLGGTIFFYVFDHHAEAIQRLVTYLQGSDFAGVIFTSMPIEGCFRLADVHLAATNGAPDVAVSMRWTSQENEYGAPGLLTVMDGKPGQGSHGSLSQFDLHNTLIVAGPDFKRGFVSWVPSGNIDVAPTILSILGVDSRIPPDGRILSEAFIDGPKEVAKPSEKVMEAHRDLGFLRWHQFLKTTTVGNTVYYEEGNGEAQIDLGVSETGRSR
jgi:arylsulfatase A-like enzyme